MQTILSFEDALVNADSLSGPNCAAKKRLLLGNGFSMACHTEFGYKALYAEVKKKGLSSQVQKIFEEYGETNFEAILKLLDQADWMSKNYKMILSDPTLSMRKDYEILKTNLAEAICSVHPAHSALIPSEKYDSCYKFITNFDDIYSINYDLLLYWTPLRHQPFAFKDGFSRDEDTIGNDCEFMPDHHYGDGKNLYFLHGALHLYHDGASVKKRVWKDTNVHLINQIQTALEKKQYPLVVAEGTADHKLIQIQESSYLYSAFKKFKKIEGHLFIFGSLLSQSDNHILDEIANNLKLQHLWIGIRGDFENSKNEYFLKTSEKLIKKRQKIVDLIKKKRKKQGYLQVHFYDSDSAKVWVN